MELLGVGHQGKMGTESLQRCLSALNEVQASLGIGRICLFIGFTTELKANAFTYLEIEFLQII
jgi:hypothetical protein